MCKKNILYSFRRCPYAMRARFALKYAGISCYIREIDLKNKAKDLIAASSKATVPVLVLSDKTVFDESLEIIDWALKQNDPQKINQLSGHDEKQIEEIIQDNDLFFVKILHRYKYKDLYPDVDFEETKKNLCQYFSNLEEMLQKNNFLIGQKMSRADIALFPFIRQAVMVDKEYFLQLGFEKLSTWLDCFLCHPLFEIIMKKYPVWSAEQEPIIF
ncbi:MAG: glutathione S-transferase N-terminal domain-containing protein [Myxococcales bacterium]|nr:glutathione S-transferase N-terminal domain-containing protein [Myxococcales bacterium]USN50611.1 MAG: glutathione S-transferase N-terminal domain-containing protein [Myxococcales bacterium]